MKLLFLILSCSYFLSCKGQKDYGKNAYLTLTADNDSCYYLVDSSTQSKILASRKMMIVENTFSDTVGFGFTVIPPGYTGDVNYLRMDTTNQAFSSDFIDHKPTTETICLNLYPLKRVSGKMVVKYFYK